MVDGMLRMIPSAKVGTSACTAMRRPWSGGVLLQDAQDIAERDVIVVDPMLATGGSASDAVGILKRKYGCRHIKLMSIIGAPEGIARMQKDHPDVDVYVAGEDERLNDRGYIVPGLGDAGDRIFGTK